MNAHSPNITSPLGSLAAEQREANRDALIARNEALRGLPSSNAMYVDGRFPSQTLDARAKLIRGLPDRIEGCDVSEQLILAQDHIDTARALIEKELEQ